ncbi:MAG: hypothetical protein LIO94_01790 [Clostridiales bacterium]|nr:hypothetical protein [Clostridiales bacterium]
MKRIRTGFLMICKEYLLILSILALLLLYSMYGNRLIAPSSFIRQITIMALLSIAVFLEYHSGVFDLAFAAQMSSSSLLCVSLADNRVPIPVCFAAVFLFNALVGCVKGFLITGFCMPSIITTLALQIILTNLCAGLTGNENFVIPHLKLFVLSPATNGFLILLLILSLGLVSFFLEHTYYGKYSKILGENPDLARKSGMKCTCISMIILVFSSLFISLPTILLIGYTGSGSIDLGADYLYKVLAAVFLGKLSNRRNTRHIRNPLVSIILSALVMVLFTYVLTANGHLNYWDKILEGLLILIAFSVEASQSTMHTSSRL